MRSCASTLAGICGTDLHVVAGDFNGIAPGAVVGHEFVGDVIAVGPGVTQPQGRRPRHRFRLHRLRAMPLVRARRSLGVLRSRILRHGESFGPALSGAQAEIVRVPFADTTLARIPRGVSDEAAILVSDNLATGWAAIERARLEPGESVAVIGGGAVGQLASLVGAGRGASAVVVVEPTRPVGALRVRMGRWPRIRERRATWSQAHRWRRRRRRDRSGGRARPLTSAFDLVRKRGRIISVGAHATEQWPLPLAQCFADEITVSSRSATPSGSDLASLRSSAPAFSIRRSLWRSG